MKTILTFSRHIALRLLGVAICALLVLRSGGILADNVTLPEQLVGVTQGFLEFTVEDYLATSQIEGRYEIEVKQIDPRLRMPACDKELTAKLESLGAPLGRVNVRIRCDGLAQWTVFVPAQVRLLREVVTATRALQRDVVLGPQDLVMRERDIGPLGPNFLTSAEEVVGQRLIRPVVADQVISPIQLEQPEMIQKGDHVVIIARSGTLAVRMPGEALAKGGLSEQIRVRNLNSKRIIKARITGPGEVEVSM